jgi:hypothetical protein
MNWTNYFRLWILTGEQPPREVLLVGSRKLTQEEINYGKTLEPIAAELLNPSPAPLRAAP